MRRTIITTVAITAVSPMSVWASTITVQSGETISEIAKRHKVSIESIMRVNGIQNSNRLFAGQKLRLPEEAFRNSEKATKEYIVLSGDTLGDIAIKNRIGIIDIIRLNNLKKSDYLYPGQKLRLPKNPNVKNTLKINHLNAKVNRRFHIIKEGETLSSISKIYNVPLHKLITLNKSITPNKINIGDKIALKENNQSPKLKNEAKTKYIKRSSDWRRYGPLKIDWASWQYIKGSYVAPTLNNQRKGIYLAVNCKSRIINATGANGAWKIWTAPKDSFEFKIINDLCKNKSS